MDNFNFEIVSKYADDPDIRVPERATASSAGYDFCASEDIIIPSYRDILGKLLDIYTNDDRAPWEELYTMDEVAEITKGLRPTLIPTGIKASMPADHFLQLSVRSSGPLKHWIILANGVGVIDADYYNNPDNEGHIYFQIINLLPFSIKIRKGDKIGQGIFIPYQKTDKDNTCSERVGGFGSTNG